MNIIEVTRKYNTKAKCVDYLEKLRWQKSVQCPKCGNSHILKNKKQLGRYYCYGCKTTFSILTDTIFENSRLPLPKWFTIIALTLNAKTGMSAKEIRRNVGITYKTAWYAAMRVRCAMIDHCNIELENIVEMDESYMGGKPKRRIPQNQPSVAKSNIITEVPKRGRGTNKTPVVGIVERKGKIVLKVIEKLTSRNLLAMLKETVNLDKSIVVTDEFRSYKKFDEVIQHYTIYHSKKQYVKGIMHTNTIEGFWNIVKLSIRSHVAVSKKYLPFYLISSQYIYNHRSYSGNLFEKFLKKALQHDKPMEHYKPLRNVKEIVYPKCKVKKE